MGAARSRDSGHRQALQRLRGLRSCALVSERRKAITSAVSLIDRALAKTPVRVNAIPGAA
jgi:hypothetical protein